MRTDRPGRRPTRRGSRRRTYRLTLASTVVLVWCALVAGAAASTATVAAGSRPAVATGGAECLRDEVEFDSGETTAVVGEAPTITGTVRGRGGDVRVTVIAGPNEGAELTVRQGPGTFTAVHDTGDGETGVDVLEASLWIGGESVDTARTTVRWTPDKPQVALAQDSESSDVRTPLELSVTVTNHDGGGDLYVTVDGANGGEERVLPVPPGPNPRQVSYVGEVGGTDSLQAILDLGDEGQYRSEVVEHDWRPTLRVEPESSSGFVGEEHVVTVSVAGADGTGDVDLEVAGANAGQPLRMSETSGEYVFRYVGVNAGQDTLRAVLRQDGRLYPSDTAVRDWVERPRPSVTVEPSGTRSQVGQVHELTVMVANSDQPPQLAVTGPGAPRGGFLPLTDAGGGRWTAQYTSQLAGTDTLVAVLPGLVRSDPATHTWDPIIEIVRPPTRSDNTVSEGLTVVVDVTGTPEAPTLEVTTDSGETFQVPLGWDGLWYGGYESGVPRTDTLTARVGSVTDRATVTWVEPDEPSETPTDHSTVPDPSPDPQPPSEDSSLDPSNEVELISFVGAPAGAAAGAVVLQPTGEDCLVVQLAPVNAASQVATTLTFSVTVLDDRGDPVPGAEVTLEARLQGEPEVQQQATTDSRGVATFDHSRSSPGAETLTASAEAVLGDGSATTTHTWLPDQGLNASVEPDGTASPVGSTFTATVTVQDEDGQPVPGATVDFRAVLPGDEDEVGDGVTDATGTLSFDYTRDTAGVETLRVVATHEGREAQASASHIWELLPGLGLLLEPAGTTSPVGSDFTATALVTLEGLPRVGAQVSFTATMPGAPTVELDGTTDELGLASVTYTRETPGQEEVAVSVTVEGRTAQASMAHTWEPGDGLSAELAPAGTASDVGTDFTATVTVTDGGDPVEGATVSLLRDMPGRGDEPADEPLEQRQPETSTGADGTATFTWSRNVPGLERVTADVLFDGRSVQAAMGHLWEGTDGDVGVVTPVLTVVGGGGLPGAPVDVTGTGCPAGSDVDLQFGGAENEDAQLGVASADEAGRYRTAVVVPDVPVGRYVLTGTCPPVTATGSLDVVTTASTTGTAAASATTTVVVLTFFVLLGGQLLRVNAVNGGG